MAEPRLAPAKNFGTKLVSSAHFRSRLAMKEIGENEIPTMRGLLCWTMIVSSFLSALGPPDGGCLRRAAQWGLAVETAVSSRPSKAAEVANPIGPGHDLRCLLVQGLHCSHAPPKPSFEFPVLKVGDEVVRRFKRHCKQTDLLEMLETQGWPHSIIKPFGSPSPVGPKNGVRDIVFDLNNEQRSRLQIHFWCDGDAVRSDIVGRLPSQQMAVRVPNHRDSPD